MPSVSMARAVLIACSAASLASMCSNFPYTISSAILNASSSRGNFLLKFRMLSATPWGPTSPSTSSARSLATLGSG